MNYNLPQVIYQSPPPQRHLHPQRLIKNFGLYLSLISFSLIAFSLTPPQVQSIEVNEEISSPDETIAEAESIGTNAYFSIVIPKIGISAKITPNVNPLNEADYTPALKEGIAHASTSFYPGQGNSIFLFAHSTDSPLNISQYNAYFYNLKDLEAGDEIILFYHYQKYFYKVKEKIIVKPDDLTALIPAYEEKLILQTCYPPGARQKRLLVIAYPVDSP